MGSVGDFPVGLFQPLDEDRTVGFTVNMTVG